MVFVYFQKLTALKKAYADIILNTAKEAAARIMVSERNAIRFQQELSTSKDEAFRILLRLKQMLDSKVLCFISLNGVDSSLCFFLFAHFLFKIVLCSSDHVLMRMAW